MRFTARDFSRLSWEDVDALTLALAVQVKRFVKKSGLSIRYIAPILRGGGIPAVILSHKLGVTDFLPLQLKSGKRGVEIKFSPLSVKLPRPKETEAVLLVDSNQVSGDTARAAAGIIHEKFGEGAKIIYVCISADHASQDAVKGVVFSACGVLTNETKSLSAAACKKYGVREKLALFPWETLAEELKEVNK